MEAAKVQPNPAVLWCEWIAGLHGASRGAMAPRWQLEAVSVGHQHQSHDSRTRAKVQPPVPVCRTSLRRRRSAQVDV